MKKLFLFLLLVCGLAQAQIVNIPDANFKAKLLQADVSNTIARDLSGSPFKIDSNNDGEIQLSEAQQVSGLSVQESNIGSLIGIVSFTNLKELYCYGNILSQLDLTGLSQLEILNFSDNQVLNFTATSLNNLQYLECSHNLLVTLDISGLQNLLNIVCDNNALSNLDFSGLNALAGITCDYNNITGVTLENLPNLDYVNFQNNLLNSVTITNCDSLYAVSLESNQLQTLSLGNLPNLNVLHCDNNQLVSLNLTGLNHLEYLSCSFNQLTGMDFSGVPNLLRFSCDNNDFGILDFSNFQNFELLNCKNNLNLTSINIKNGKQQFYNIDLQNEWSNCPNLMFVCADEIEIPTLRLVLQNNGLNNVTLNTYCSFNPGGDYNTITGKTLFDANTDGCDVSDLPQSFVKVKINDGTTEGASFGDANGNYLFHTQAGNFTVTPDVENASFFNFSPVHTVVNFPDNNNNVAVQNFCVTSNGIHPDLEIVIAPIIPARPGFNAVYKIVYKNKGNQIQSQSYGINFFYNQNVMTFVSATQLPDSQNAGALSWNYSSLMPFESRSIEVTFHINSPTDANPVNNGDLLQLTASLLPMAGDETTQDNLFQFNQTVVNSYDPNDKYCLEGDVESSSKIGDYLHYTINFENIGSAEATNIIVKDVIDTTKFDEKTLQVLNSSHPVRAKIKGNVAEFIFENIQLEAAGNGNGGGHGNILLKVRTRDALQAGDEVTNKAEIYFDYNAPIETDAARTIFQSLGTSEHFTDSSVSVYPNPTNGILEIKSDTAIKSIQLFDVQGRVLRVMNINKMNGILDMTGQASGVYLVKVTTDEGVKVERVLKK